MPNTAAQAVSPHRSAQVSNNRLESDALSGRRSGGVLGHHIAQGKRVLSEKNKSVLAAMRLVEIFSTKLNTTSWIWGGFTVDIHTGHLLREHNDLDYLTLNLHKLAAHFACLFEKAGWQVQYLENGDLKLRQDGIKIQLGHIELFDRAKWTHNGEQGCLCFPIGWLTFKSAWFHDKEVHVVELEFQYVLLEHPEMLNPAWKLRDKDIVAKQQLRAILLARKIDPQALHQFVTDIRQ